jgi:hypothetical protein
MMDTAHTIAIVTLAAACTFTGLVVAFVLRAQRLNGRDCCGWCGEQLGPEGRHRFHARTVCAACWRRLRLVTLPRVVRITVLLAAWIAGAVALAELIGEGDPRAVVWAPVYGGVVLVALIAGALPPFTRAADRTAATLRRLHSLRQGDQQSTRPRTEE